MGIFGFLKSLSGDSDDKENKSKKHTSRNSKKPPVTRKMNAIDKQNRMVDEILAKYSTSRRKVSAEEKKKKEDEKKSKLIQKYGKEVGTKLFKKQFFAGMTLEMLKEIKSRHDKKTSNVTNGKETVKLYYGKKKNRLGNDSFKLEVTLKDGKVTGWKDLTSVGTRNK